MKEYTGEECGFKQVPGSMEVVLLSFMATRKYLDLAQAIHKLQEDRWLNNLYSPVS